MQRTRHIVPLVLALMGALIVVPVAPAQAAGYGPGFDVGLGRLGAYVTPLGTQAYCLEIAKNRPLGATDSGTVGGWAGLGADSLSQLNWVLHEYGQSADPVVTAAVNLYVWSLADQGTYGSHGMSGDQYYSGRAGDSRDAVLGMLAEIRAAAGGVLTVGTVSVELHPDLSGRVTVDDPAARGGTLTIEGADIDGPIPVTDGSVVELTAQPPIGARTATVSARATFGARSYPAAITVHDSGLDQHLAGPAGDIATASAQAEVPLEIHPVLESRVEDGVIALGEPATDGLTASVAGDSPAPWREGELVIARGTLYGPFPSAPLEQATPPHGSPIAWTELVELEGPGAATSGGSFRPTAPGHYTWVWSIAVADQHENNLVPAEYSWSDRFGLAAESLEVVQRLPSTGAEDEPSWWLGGLGAVLLGAGLAGIAACMRIRLRRAAPTS